MSQTYTNWECLLIDDGSKDKSKFICDEYVAKDSRFRVFHKKNGGVGSARNIGLNNATGKWITFMDSDDWCDNDWLANFTHSDVVDLVVQGFKAMNWFGCPNEIRVQNPHKLYKKDEFRDFLNATVASGNIGYLWCRAFKSSIIQENHIRFDIRFKLTEDEEFIFHYMTFINSILITEKTAYHYVVPNFISKYNKINIDYQLICNDLILDYAFSLLHSYRHTYMKVVLERFVNLAVAKYRAGAICNKQKYYRYKVIYKKNTSHRLKTKVFMVIENFPNLISLYLHKFIWKIL